MVRAHNETGSGLVARRRSADGKMYHIIRGPLRVCTRFPKQTVKGWRLLSVGGCEGSGDKGIALYVCV